MSPATDKWAVQYFILLSFTRRKGRLWNVRDAFLNDLPFSFPSPSLLRQGGGGGGSVVRAGKWEGYCIPPAKNKQANNSTRRRRHWSRRRRHHHHHHNKNNYNYTWHSLKALCNLTPHNHHYYHLKHAYSRTFSEKKKCLKHLKEKKSFTHKTDRQADTSTMNMSHKNKAKRRRAKKWKTGCWTVSTSWYRAEPGRTDWKIWKNRSINYQ